MEGPLFPHRVGKKHGHVSPRTSAADPRQTRLPSFIPSQMTVGLEDDYHALKKDHDTIEIELKTLRETYNSRQDTWIKEKLDMQVRIKRTFQIIRMIRKNRRKKWGEWEGNMTLLSFDMIRNIYIHIGLMDYILLRLLVHQSDNLYI